MRYLLSLFLNWGTLQPIHRPRIDVLEYLLSIIMTIALNSLKSIPSLFSQVIIRILWQPTRRRIPCTCWPNFMALNPRRNLEFYSANISSANTIIYKRFPSTSRNIHGIVWDMAMGRTKSYTIMPLCSHQLQPDTPWSHRIAMVSIQCNAIADAICSCGLREIQMKVAEK